MGIFKTIKRKVGNALIPVIGTILALTILAGSVVAVALNSSKIVYRQNRLEQQNNGREILFIASRYFSQMLNDDVDESVAKQTVKDIFEYLQAFVNHLFASGHIHVGNIVYRGIVTGVSVDVVAELHPMALEV